MKFSLARAQVVPFRQTLNVIAVQLNLLNTPNTCFVLFLQWKWRIINKKKVWPGQIFQKKWSIFDFFSFFFKKFVGLDHPTNHPTIRPNHQTGLMVWQTSNSSRSICPLYNDTNFKSLGFYLSPQQSKYGFWWIRSDRQTHPTIRPSNHQTGLMVWLTSNSSRSIYPL